MARGGARAGAGRPAGSRNRRTRAVLELLETAGVDPVRELIRLAGDAEKRGDLDTARRCWTGLLGYRYSRPAAGGATEGPAPALELPSWFRPGRNRQGGA